MLPAMSWQTVPDMQAALELHVRVQRWAPPGTMGRHTSGEAHSPSEVQRSNSCSLIVPPVVLLDDDVDEDVAAADDDVATEDVDDEEDVLPPPELALALLAVLVLLVLEPEVELPEAPPVPPGTHCAF
jgi:hypothetical protein